MGRYKGVKRFNNSEKYYEYLRKKRNLKVARHYETPILKNPSVQERMGIAADTHVWSLGDRYYKLAHKYYGDATYWWIIAIFNKKPTEADLEYGDVIYVPTPLQKVLRVMQPQ